MLPFPGGVDDSSFTANSPSHGNALLKRRFCLLITELESAEVLFFVLLLAGIRPDFGLFQAVHALLANECY